MTDDSRGPDAAGHRRNALEGNAAVREAQRRARAEMQLIADDARRFRRDIDDKLQGITDGALRRSVGGR
ncbi:hypothetical protein M446_6378 [Methylobacterium sp. 4-46]|uniref:hypothetical protein n=1 Tax=unclassified Methylobacterium TaxID=2615210 RepID=UPI000165CC6B|nr:MULTISPECIES: hypothetical protein [Methylobacterium]ACA20642.1 hypothetical protein M446_6378 [Methylobacterium sp. 4-46]WFT79804.1 hypothetical protein QA634_32215 [Methylobacterium nodulans]